MRVLVMGVLVFLATCSTAREVTHEDIKEAMLQLVHIVKASEDKLERHELREKALGEQIKKGLANLEKRHKTLEPLKGAISRLDERISNVETILLQKDEHERQQAQKSNDMMSSLESNLQSWKDAIANEVRAELKNLPPPQVHKNDEVQERLKSLDEKLTQRVDSMATAIEAIKKDVAGIKSAQAENCKKGNADDKIFAKQSNDIEKLLTKYDNKLTEYQSNMTKMQTGMRPFEEVSAADEAWHSKMALALENQQSSLEKIHKSLATSEEILKSLPTDKDLKKYNNETIQALRDVQYDLKSNTERGITKLDSGINECISAVNLQSNILQENITGFATEFELNMKPLANLFQSLDKLQAELQTVSKIDRVMLQTADNVLDNRKKIEYAKHQTLQELQAIIKSENKELNRTIHAKFDELQTAMLDEQTGALVNVSKKIETEVSQVWRQIGIMYQQLTANSGVLDKLQVQTDEYVNASSAIMGNMGGKIGTMTTQMTEVYENLNHLQGRLLLVTQEFNKIKTALGNALDEIKSRLMEAKEKIKDSGPGPHYFKDPEEETS